MKSQIYRTLLAAPLISTLVATGSSASAESSLAIPLTEGGFYKVPAGIGHVSSCISDVDCVTFLYQDGKFEFIPIER